MLPAFPVCVVRLHSPPRTATSASISRSQPQPYCTKFTYSTTGQNSRVAAPKFLRHTRHAQRRHGRLCGRPDPDRPAPLRALDGGLQWCAILVLTLNDLLPHSMNQHPILILFQVERLSSSMHLDDHLNSHLLQNSEQQASGKRPEWSEVGAELLVPYILRDTAGLRLLRKVMHSSHTHKPDGFAHHRPIPHIQYSAAIPSIARHAGNTKRGPPLAQRTGHNH